jgi:hypothetical protein
MRTTDMNDANMHLDEGQIATLRDERTAEPWASSHLDACAVCTAELTDARTRAHDVADALATLDRPVDVTAAKAAVRRRLDRARIEDAPVRRRIPLGRVAAILLVTAGAASALPWSPLARWWSAPSAEEESSPPAATVTSAPDAGPSTASIAVDVADGIQVIVTGASAGATIDVVWTDAASARVTAASGSRFTLATGRVEVQAVEGIVSLELPRTARSGLVVNGRTYLEPSPQGSTLGATVVGPAAEVTDARVRFLVPAP